MDMSMHGSHGSSESDAGSFMHSTFFSATNTPLYSTSWAPSSTGSYTGSCIFLVVLALTFRLLLAGKQLLERRWLDKAIQRRYIKVDGLPTEAEKIDADRGSEWSTLLSPRGEEERVRVVTNHVRPVMPFRLSVDLPRALFVMVIAGVGYLL